MVGKQLYSVLRQADPLRGERVRLILKTLFPGRSNVAIGHELGYDESSIRVWTKTGIISAGLLKHLVKYGVSERYIISGEGSLMCSGLVESAAKEDAPMDRKALMLSLSMQETLVRISRYLSGDRKTKITRDDMQNLRSAAHTLSKCLEREIRASTKNNDKLKQNE